MAGQHPKVTEIIDQSRSITRRQLAINIHTSPQFERAAGAALRNDLVGKGLSDCVPRLGQGLIERLPPGDICHEHGAAVGQSRKRKYTLQRNRLGVQVHFGLTITMQINDHISW